MHCQVLLVVIGPSMSNKQHLHKFILPEAVCCCLQTCNFCFGELLSLDISIPGFIVIGPSMSKL